MKKKNFVFICQITESHLKVIKCLCNPQREFVGLEVEAIPPDIDDKKITEKLAEIFKRLDYSHNPVIICLPRSKVTSRYLKVPAHTQQEIEKILSLQAPRYLSYPPRRINYGLSNYLYG